MSSETYVKAALRDVEHKLDKAGLRLPAKASTPFVNGYRCGKIPAQNWMTEEHLITMGKSEFYVGW